jgi:hypothetical protein
MKNNNICLREIGCLIERSRPAYEFPLHGLFTKRLLTIDIHIVLDSVGITNSKFGNYPAA